MRIGIPAERRVEEGRVALMPSAVAELVEAGHELFVERGAGERTQFADAEYAAAGAALVSRADPTFTVAGVIHSCVANMPGAVPRTATRALSPVLLPYVRALADHGVDEALAARPDLAAGLNVAGGRVVHAGVAEAHGYAADKPEPVAAR